MAETYRFSIILEPQEEGGFTVLVPALPEVVTGSIQNNRFNKVSFDRSLGVRPYRPTPMNRLENIHLALRGIWKGGNIGEDCTVTRRRCLVYKIYTTLRHPWPASFKLTLRQLL